MSDHAKPIASGPRSPATTWTLWFAAMPALHGANHNGCLTLTLASIGSGYLLHDGGAVRPTSITCLTCMTTRYHPQDIATRYCVRCALCHEDRR